MAVAGPYSAPFCAHSLVECTDATVMVDSKVLHAVCRRNFGDTELNRLLAQFIYSLTACFS